MELNDAARLVHRALEEWGIDDDAEVHFVKYRENHVFRADLPDGRSLAVRLHRPGYRRPEEILAEVGHLDMLGRGGVAVPVLVAARNGRILQEVSVGGASRLVSIQQWIEDATPFGDIVGALDGTHSPPPDAFRDIGRAIGRMHDVSARVDATSGLDRDAWDADGLVGPEPLWGDPLALAGLIDAQRATLRRAATSLHERLSRLPRHPEVFGAIHADTTPENILHTPRGIVLIDFDDFGTGWRIFDLVTAVFHHARQDAYPRYEEALREGYAEWRSLSPAESDAWDDLMLARGMTYLGWAAARPGDPASTFISTELAPWVCETAAASLAGDPPPWRRRAEPTHSKES